MNKDIKELLESFLNGNSQSFSYLVEFYFLDKINRIAKRYKYFFPTLSLEDLVEEGITALYKAAKDWKKNKKKDFSQYAYFCIKKSIKKYVIESLSLVKIPSYLINSFKKIMSLINKENSSLQEIVKKTKLDIEKIKSLLVSQPKKHISFDEYLDRQEESETLYEIFADETAKLPEELLRIQENKNEVERLLRILTPQERKILKMRYGLIDHKHHSLKDISEKLKIKPNKVKDIEFQAIQKLKKYLEEV